MIKMRTVNHYLIELALAYLEEAEADNRGPLWIDPDDEENTKRMFRLFVAPRIECWGPIWRERLKTSLAYFLKRPQVLEDEVLANIQDLTMEEPNDITRFFRWLFEVIFPNESLMSIDVSDVKEKNDVMEMNLGSGEST